MTGNRNRSPRLPGLLLAAGVGVAGWKAAALLQAGPEAGVVKVLLALVGLIFVGCGLLVPWKRPGKDTLLFAGFCLCAGLHWGGPLELPSGALRTALLLFYLLISSVLGEALFLHFALSFPKATRAAESKAVRFVLYGPLVVGTLLAILAVSAPGGSGAQAAGQSGFLLLHALVSNVFPALVLVLYVTYLFRPGLDRNERPFVGLMVAGMLAAWVPYLVASALGWDTDPWNLAMALLPIAFAVGILGIKRHRESDRASGS